MPAQEDPIRAELGDLLAALTGSGGGPVALADLEDTLDHALERAAAHCRLIADHLAVTEEWTRDPAPDFRSSSRFAAELADALEAAVRP